MSDIFLNTLKKVKEKLDADGKIEKPYRFLFLGYTDIHATDNFYQENYNPNDLLGLEARPNTEKLKSIHGCGHEVSIVPTIKSVLGLMFGDEVEYDVLDFQLYEGSEIIIDLNVPVEEKYKCKFDFVIDNGTTEHVFNYAQALMNCAAMVSHNGYVFHSVPMNWGNHGFYNISPTLFYDFYDDNGFDTIHCQGVGKISDNGVLKNIEAKLPLWERFSLSSLKGAEVNLEYIAHRVELNQEFVIPIQRKYRDASTWI